MIFKAGPSVISSPTFQQTGPFSPSLDSQSDDERGTDRRCVPHISRTYSTSHSFIKQLNGSDSSTLSATPSHVPHRTDDAIRQGSANPYPRGYGAQIPPAKRCCQILRRYALAFISQLKAHRNLGTPPAKTNYQFANSARVNVGVWVRYVPLARLTRG